MPAESAFMVGTMFGTSYSLTCICHPYEAEESISIGGSQGLEHT